MKKLILAAVLCGAAMQAVAADWVEVGSNKDQILYGDADSRISNRAWFKTDYFKPQKLSNGKFYKSDMALVEADCVGGGRFQLLSEVYYSSSGKVVDSYTPRYPEYQYVIPGSAGESVYNFICHKQPR